MPSLSNDSPSMIVESCFETPEKKIIKFFEGLFTRVKFSCDFRLLEDVKEWIT